MNAERIRLLEDSQRIKNWKRWGPYLSERQWGTVREDYSEDGESWRYFSHDQARSRAYRWGEDGLLGISDRQCRLCFSLAMWNGRDPILKERLFGVSGPEGNHGEDVKEFYFYLDSTPTHSYMKALYKYPQCEFPYIWLLHENCRRRRSDTEFELADTGIFESSCYFDIFAEYAKASPDDILVRITAVNRGPEIATLHLLPTLWFRNTWRWGDKHENPGVKPRLALQPNGSIVAFHQSLGQYRLLSEGAPEWLFTENETNVRRLFHADNPVPYVKDAFHEFLIHGRTDAVNPRQEGTKAAAWYRMEMPPGTERVVRLRLSIHDAGFDQQSLADDFDRVFSQRLQEADEFYASGAYASLDDEQQRIRRQAYASLLWSKQFYHYVIRTWLDGDANMPSPPAARKAGRNVEWLHLFNRDVISMPDKWEYPWYASWDLAFHMIPFAHVDPDFAKQQLVLFLREWYMHPNGQLPAYEFAFSDVNPPVHAWACWRVYKMTGVNGERDRVFLSRTFQKLILNFTWWVNRKDTEGKNIFGGGFLGLDNIGVFDRSKPLPTGGYLEQADGTAWMAFFCATMLSIALELSREDPAAEDMASKFFEHFVSISDAMNSLGGTGLWDEADGFYYDQLHVAGRFIPLKVRSLVGLIPLLAVEVLDDELIQDLHGFRKRMEWFLEYREDLSQHISYMCLIEGGKGRCHRLLAIPSRARLERVLHRMLDENEFLSPYGIRSLSKYHEMHPYIFHVNGEEHRVSYVPGESDSGFFGGNSNWRGPVWFPINFLLVEALERYHHFYGDTFQVEMPTGSGHRMSLGAVAKELARRLTSIFLPDAQGHRPCHGNDPRFAHDPHWRNLVLFHEYFHGDTGRGCGASHQTGWTALITRWLSDVARQ